MFKKQCNTSQKLFLWACLPLDSEMQCHTFTLPQKICQMNVGSTSKMIWRSLIFKPRHIAIEMLRFRWGWASGPCTNKFEFLVWELSGTHHTFSLASQHTRSILTRCVRASQAPRTWSHLTKAGSCQVGDLIHHQPINVQSHDEDAGRSGQTPQFTTTKQHQWSSPTCGCCLPPRHQYQCQHPRQANPGKHTHICHQC